MSDFQGSMRECARVTPMIRMRFRQYTNTIEDGEIAIRIWFNSNKTQGISLSFVRFNTNYPGFQSWGGAYETALINQDGLFYNDDWDYSNVCVFDTLSELYAEIERVGRLYSSSQ